MNKLALSTVIAGAVTAGTVGLGATATAAPAGPSSAADTVRALEANGYMVILNKIGGAPLSECTVATVHPGRQVTEPRTSREGGRDPHEQVLYTTVYVDARC
jgi:hypothetical protein